MWSRKLSCCDYFREWHSTYCWALLGETEAFTKYKKNLENVVRKVKRPHPPTHTFRFVSKVELLLLFFASILRWTDPLKSQFNKLSLHTQKTRHFYKFTKYHRAPFLTSMLFLPCEMKAPLPCCWQNACHLATPTMIGVFHLQSLIWEKGLISHRRVTAAAATSLIINHSQNSDSIALDLKVINVLCHTRKLFNSGFQFGTSKKSARFKERHTVRVRNDKRWWTIRIFKKRKNHCHILEDYICACVPSCSVPNYMPTFI